MGQNQFTALATLLEKQEGPCLSLYQATHRSHPDNAQDPIRFKNLVRELQESLSGTYTKAEYEPLLQPLHDLAEDFDFWQHTLDGLAIFRSPKQFKLIQLQRPTPDFAVVSDSFHIKPLLRQTQTLDRFQVLCLTRQAVRLFEGNRDTLDHIVPGDDFPTTADHDPGHDRRQGSLHLSSYRLGSAAGSGTGAVFHGHDSRADAIEIQTTNYFRAVDKAVVEQISKPSGVPLILVALPEYQGEYRKLSNNPQLLEEGINIDPTSLTIEALHEACRKLILPIANERAARTVAQFHKQLGTGLGSDNIHDILPAILDGRVNTLMVSAEQQVAGRIHRDQRVIEPLESLDSPDADDVLDDLAEMTLRRSGTVLVLPEDVMPTDTGAAAIYTF